MQNDSEHEDSKQKTKIGFVVLHYGAQSVTWHCVASILQMDQPERLNIVIVDNDVPSGQFFADEPSSAKWHCFADRKNVHILYTGGGKGFSEANNLGYAWLRRQNDSHALAAIVVCNNDIVFPMRDFPIRLQGILERHDADVFGPDIIVPRHDDPQGNGSQRDFPSDGAPVRDVPLDGASCNGMVPAGLHQNPMDTRLRTIKEVRQTMRLNAVALATLPVSYPFVNQWLRKMEARREEGKLQDGKTVSQNKQNADHEVRTGKPETDHAALAGITAPILFGACLIFAERFLQNEEKAFYPETYFYYEEYILAKRCEAAGYRMCYEPSLQVLHESGRATRDDAAHDRKKYIRRKLQNTKDACRVYLSMFE